MNQTLKSIGRVILCFLSMMLLIYLLFFVIASVFEFFDYSGGRSFLSVRIILIVLGVFLMIIYFIVASYDIFKINEVITSLILAEILICVFAFPQIYHCIIESYWDLVYRYTLYFVEGTVYVPGAILIGTIVRKYLLKRKV